MNTKNKRNGKRISGLIAMIALLAAMSGCASNAPQPTANQTANTAAPANTATPANTLAPANTSNNSSKATADNPATAFYGTWEGELPGQPYSSFTFEKATEKGGSYTGDLAEGNRVVGEYTVGDDNKIILYIKATDEKLSFPYKFSDGGKTLTLQAKPPIEFTKGTSNTAIQDDVNIIPGDWYLATDRNISLNFSSASQSDEGWGGTYSRSDSTNQSPVDNGTFKIKEAGKITFTSYSGGSNSYTYEIDGGALHLTRKGAKEVFVR